MCGSKALGLWTERRTLDARIIPFCRNMALRWLFGTNTVVEAVNAVFDNHHSSYRLKLALQKKAVFARIRQPIL